MKTWIFKKMIFPIFKEYCDVKVEINNNVWNNIRAKNEPNKITILLDRGMKSASISNNIFQPYMFENNVIGIDVIYVNTEILSQLKKLDAKQKRFEIKDCINNNITLLYNEKREINGFVKNKA